MNIDSGLGTISHVHVLLHWAWALLLPHPAGNYSAITKPKKLNESSILIKK